MTRSQEIPRTGSADDHSRTPALDLLADHHTHTLFSDGHGSLQDILRAAEDAGLAQVTISDHVRESTTWLPEYARAVRRAGSRTDVQLRCAVEAQVLDGSGRLDLPSDLDGVVQVNIGDHRFPGSRGPERIEEVRRQLIARRRRPQDVADALVDALAASVVRVERAVLVHPFSLLTEVGLGEDLVSVEHLAHLGSACVAAGAAVEVSERWRCPTASTAAVLASYGVRLVAGSDAHQPGHVGRYRYVAEVAAALGGDARAH